MLKIKVMNWPLQTLNGKYKEGYIFINPIHIMYISPYFDERENLYTLTMFNSESFIIDQNNLEKIIKYKNNDTV